mgnify:CR=1 FL=1
MKNWMVSAAFGQELQCFPAMLTDLTFQSFLLKDGQKVKWMDNFLLVEANFLKLYQPLEKMFQLINNGKMFDILSLMFLD